MSKENPSNLQLYGDLPLTTSRIARAKEMEAVFNSLGRAVPVVFKPIDNVFPIRFLPKNNK